MQVKLQGNSYYLQFVNIFQSAAKPLKTDKKAQRAKRFEKILRFALWGLCEFYCIILAKILLCFNCVRALRLCGSDRQKAPENDRYKSYRICDKCAVDKAVESSETCSDDNYEHELDRGDLELAQDLKMEQ